MALSKFYSLHAERSPLDLRSDSGLAIGGLAWLSLVKFPIRVGPSRLE